MSFVKVLYGFGSMFQINSLLPSCLLVSFPLDQIFRFSISKFDINDFVNFKFFFTVNDHWWWWWFRMTTSYWVRLSKLKLYHWEDIMQSLH